MKNYLAVDLGEKRCGIAKEINKIAMPEKIVPRHHIIKELKKLILERKITDIVVGLPYDLYGKDMLRLQKAEKFIDTLRATFPSLKIHGFDERFTTFEADRILTETDFSGNKKKNRDDISAALILEWFLTKK